MASILFCYDGTELAEYAIAQASSQLSTEREAVVAVVWQPAEVGFTPVDGQHFDADSAVEVRAAAEALAEHGALLAEKAGFRARGVAVEATPVWKGLTDAAEQAGADVIVIGTHQHSGLAARLFGHVTSDVLGHTAASVLVVHQPE